MPRIPITWIDSAAVVRKVWPEYKMKGYGLANMADVINYRFKHHDALEDAQAAGYIMLEALTLSGTTLSDWIPQ